MNILRLQHAKRLAKAACFGLVVFAASAQASTHIDLTVDANAHCITAGGGTYNVFPRIALPIGTWRMTVLSSTVDLCPTIGYCPQPEVNLSLFGSDFPYEKAMVAKPKVRQTIEVTAPNDSVWGYITDEFCPDNSGTTVVRFTKK